MTLPVINAVINFSTGPSFAQAMILDTGILDTNILADSVAVIVDVSDQVDRIQTNRGRNAQADQFQTGTLTCVSLIKTPTLTHKIAAGRILAS
jgi:hypothetical protein